MIEQRRFVITLPKGHPVREFKGLIPTLAANERLISVSIDFVAVASVMGAKACGNKNGQCVDGGIVVRHVKELQ
jgi:hypothetical protein